MLLATRKFNKSIISVTSKEWNTTLWKIQVNNLLQWLILYCCVRKCKSLLLFILEVLTWFIKYSQINLPLFSVQYIFILQLFIYNVLTPNPQGKLLFWFKQKINGLLLIKSKMCYGWMVDSKYWWVKTGEEMFPNSGFLRAFTIHSIPT
jgi:hypothetical protein